MSPCKGCIVDIMCKEPCGKFVNYLRLKECRRDKGSYYKGSEVHDLSTIAWGIRNGMMELCEDGKHWKWYND